MSLSKRPSLGQRPSQDQRQGPGYVLSSEERALDCRRLTGRMQVRILQVRDRAPKSDAAYVAYMKSALRASRNLMLRGSTRAGEGTQEERAARDIAMLRAYNQLLAQKGCPAFDLEAELKVKSLAHTPRPVRR